MLEQMRTALMDAATALETATWTAIEGTPEAPVPAGAYFFQGASGPWKFVVTAFDLVPQGFPPGTLGYDGMARNEAEGLILRLTRPLAEQAYLLARLAR